MDPRVAAFSVTGLAAATFTPYNEDGSVAPQLVDAHCADLAKNKVSAAFINGTTGDSMSLSVAERKTIAEAWVASGKAHGVVIINHIGANSITDAKELAAHAAAIGCQAISAMPPFFFKPASARALALWLKEVGAAAPGIPLYYYCEMRVLAQRAPRLPPPRTYAKRHGFCPPFPRPSLLLRLHSLALSFSSASRLP
jgi:dihydrodipicolinate synthase/N-acetylneuraminate lyase